MNINIYKSEYTEHWHKTVVCDRCKRIIASAQCNKKPREDEVSICRDCAVEMWTKEKEALQSMMSSSAGLSWKGQRSNDG